MDILAWIVVGLVAGWLASVVMRGGGYGSTYNEAKPTHVAAVDRRLMIRERRHPCR
jgi:hypothetical protein